MLFLFNQLILKMLIQTYFIQCSKIETPVCNLLLYTKVFFSSTMMEYSNAFGLANTSATMPNVNHR